MPTLLIPHKHHSNDTSFKTGNRTDLRYSLQYEHFDMSHSFWGHVAAKNRCLLVTVGRVILRLASTDVGLEA